MLSKIVVTYKRNANASETHYKVLKTQRKKAPWVTPLKSLRVKSVAVVCGNCGSLRLLAFLGSLTTSPAKSYSNFECLKLRIQLSIFHLLMLKVDLSRSVQ